MVVFGTTFDLQGQISDVCSFGTSLAGIEGTLSTVVGEFCGAQTDCIVNSSLLHWRQVQSIWMGTIPELDMMARYTDTYWAPKIYTNSRPMSVTALRLMYIIHAAVTDCRKMQQSHNGQRTNGPTRGNWSRLNWTHTTKVLWFGCQSDSRFGMDLLDRQDWKFTLLGLPATCSGWDFPPTFHR